ncbi:hypothetical protein CVV38_01770 [Candidatus Peregrinibacteria bacterium HGW-Peregrinibacteria-1]|jgi:hypothetical protein|nr:MAG: hypothetical protein CVV38_01770 [Candidatus Peregrinibacteria bacterium HGW-Peregrinibacteria-1]
MSVKDKTQTKAPTNTVSEERPDTETTAISTPVPPGHETIDTTLKETSSKAQKALRERPDIDSLPALSADPNSNRVIIEEILAVMEFPLLQGASLEAALRPIVDGTMQKKVTSDKLKELFHNKELLKWIVEGLITSIFSNGSSQKNPIRKDSKIDIVLEDKLNTFSVKYDPEQEHTFSNFFNEIKEKYGSEYDLKTWLLAKSDTLVQFVNQRIDEVMDRIYTDKGRTNLRLYISAYLDRFIHEEKHNGQQNIVIDLHELTTQYMKMVTKLQGGQITPAHISNKLREVCKEYLDAKQSEGKHLFIINGKQKKEQIYFKEVEDKISRQIDHIYPQYTILENPKIIPEPIRRYHNFWQDDENYLNYLTTNIPGFDIEFDPSNEIEMDEEEVFQEKIAALDEQLRETIFKEINNYLEKQIELTGLNARQREIFMGSLTVEACDNLRELHSIAVKSGELAERFAARRKIELFNNIVSIQTPFIKNARSYADKIQDKLQNLSTTVALDFTRTKGLPAGTTEDQISSYDLEDYVPENTKDQQRFMETWKKSEEISNFTLENYPFDKDAQFLQMQNELKVKIEEAIKALRRNSLIRDEHNIPVNYTDLKRIINDTTSTTSAILIASLKLAILEQVFIRRKQLKIKELEKEIASIIQGKPSTSKDRSPDGNQIYQTEDFQVIDHFSEDGRYLDTEVILQGDENYQPDSDVDSIVTGRLAHAVFGDFKVKVLLVGPDNNETLTFVDDKSLQSILNKCIVKGFSPNDFHDICRMTVIIDREDRRGIREQMAQQFGRYNTVKRVDNFDDFDPYTDETDLLPRGHKPSPSSPDYRDFLTYVFKISVEEGDQVELEIRFATANILRERSPNSNSSHDKMKKRAALKAMAKLAPHEIFPQLWSEADNTGKRKFIIEE